MNKFELWRERSDETFRAVERERLARLAREGRRSSGHERDGHAVVIGGSVAGLLAARVLAEHFERVTVVERDTLPDGYEARKGVPQGRHSHALLAGGLAVVEDLFPGMTDELISDGAASADISRDARWFQPGGYRPRFASGVRGVSMSRPFFEGHVLRRVRALANVEISDGTSVTGLLADDGRVSGVVVRRRDGDAGNLLADLVVDAGGRGSRAPGWMEKLGYDAPEEERIEVGIGYTTRLYRRRPGDLSGAVFSIIQATPPDGTRTGVINPLEGGRWLVSLAGWLGDHAPTDEEGFVDYARSLPAPEIYEVIKDAEPLGEATVHKFPANLRRRYEKLSRVPEGYVVTGDALSSFNPVYGQGMTVAALEAVALDELLREGREGLPRRFYRRAAGIIDTPWQLAAGADLAYPEVEGERTRSGEIVGRYIGRLMRAATRDEAVSLAFIKVTNLLAPPATLFHPAIVFRVLRHALVRNGRADAPQSAEAPVSEAA